MLLDLALYFGLLSLIAFDAALSPTKKLNPSCFAPENLLHDTTAISVPVILPA